jgi:hypothetical protein
MLQLLIEWNIKIRAFGITFTTLNGLGQLPLPVDKPDLAAPMYLGSVEQRGVSIRVGIIRTKA